MNNMTALEFVWLVVSLISSVYCVKNLAVYSKKYTEDPTREKYFDVLTNGLRLVGAFSLFVTAVINSWFINPLTPGWRAVSQTLLMIVTLVLCGIPILMDVARGGDPRDS